MSYFITVVPEKQAEYIGGQNLLIDYLRANSNPHTTGIEQKNLKPGQYTFTVNKEGSISKARLGTSSGYPEVDNILLDLIRNMPGKWIPATNSQGERVEQEYVFFFGVDGC